MPAASIQVVFFDLGYTLINFEGDYQRVTADSYLALANVLINMGFDLDAARFTERFSEVLSAYYQARDDDLIERPVEQYLARVLHSFGYIDPPEDIVRYALTTMYRATEGHWRLEKGALPLLQELTREGYRLGLISNAANAENVNRLIDRFNLRHYFEAILVSATEKVRKPDTRIYSRALRAMNITASSAVMVGDTLTADILGAQNAGLRAIWITTRENHPDNSLVSGDITPDAVIDCLSELPAALRNLN